MVAHAGAVESWPQVPGEPGKREVWSKGISYFRMLVNYGDLDGVTHLKNGNGAARLAR